MKQKWLILMAMLIAGNVCFAKITVLTFEIYEVTDYDEMDDNFLVFNKTDTNIARVFFYGVKEKDCPRGFNLDDFVIERDSHHIILNNTPELICMIKDVKKNKNMKKNLPEQLLYNYRYFILVVDGMLPEGYDYQIKKMFARRDDLYVHIGDNYSRQNSSNATSHYDYAETISNIGQSLGQGLKDLNDSLMDNLKNQPCGSCMGNGKCSSCGGTGKRSGNDCYVCHGSGVCTRCNGTGKAHAL